jgi:signal peptidase I
MSSVHRRTATKAEATVDFVLVLMAREGGAWVEAASRSMSPLIQPGDQLRLSALDPAGVRPGTIVAYRRGDTLVVHRLIAVTPAGFVTKGDALTDTDVPVAAAEIVGRVAAIRSPDGRLLDLERAPWPRIGRALAFVARIRGANPIVWKVLRVPFYVAASLGR